MKYYRFFEKKEYRKKFIDGIVRFGNLKSYRENENEAIRDKDEGKAIVKYKTNSGDMNSSGETPRTFFICSLCDENIDPIKKSKDFKKRYAVIINDIGKIHDLLEKNSSFDRKIGKIELIQVVYNRDDLKRLPIKYPPYYYHFSQKLLKYSDEHEWRFVMHFLPIKKYIFRKLVFVNGIPCNRLKKQRTYGKFIKIGDIRDYVSTKDF